MNTCKSVLNGWIGWSILAATLLSMAACGGSSDDGPAPEPDTQQPVDVAPPPPVDDITQPDATPPCEPVCVDKTCGDNGCGGTCGTCDPDETCSAAGVCESTPQCVPDCAAGSCGDDGCGGTCTCSPAESCNDTTKLCEADPACKGFNFEGCCDGETLKYCENGAIKGVDCAAQPSCGWSTDNGFYNCDSEAGTSDPSGTFSSVCPACDPQCVDKQCGDDGCGGTCGTCAEGKKCAPTTFQCITDPCADGSVSYEGCCDGELLKFCEDGAYNEIDCAENASCGWDSGGSYYNCGTDGTADPSGAHPLSCGPTCEAQCTGKVCGDDGCGGDCGTCDGTCSDDGTTCTPKPCVDGEVCSTGNPCDTAAVTCDAMTGLGECVKTGSKPDNLSCGGGKICKSGECVDA